MISIDNVVMVRFSVPNSYTNYRPNKLPLLLATWCEMNTTLTTNTDPNPNPNPNPNRHRRPVLTLTLGYSNN